MVTVVLGILTAISVPMFSSWLSDRSLQAAARGVLSNFQLAKMTATKTNTNCAVTFNQPYNGKTYDFLVYIDANNNSEFDEATEEVVTRKSLGDYGNVEFDLSQGDGTGLTFAENDDGLPTIAFQFNGIPVNNSGGLGMGTVFLRNTANRTARVIVSSAGHVRID